MAYLVIEINTGSGGLTISDMNASCNMSGKRFESVNGVVDLLGKILGNGSSATVKIVSKDAATTISTSGTGSASNTFTF